MKKMLLGLFVASVVPLAAQAEERLNGFALTVDPVMADTESPAGNRAEKHGTRIGVELGRMIWPRFEVFAGAGGERLRIENAGVKTDLNHVDVRLGARQYFSLRQIQAWSLFVDGSLSDAWLRDVDSAVGGNRRYGGWNASFGMAKPFSEHSDVRLSLGYTRLLASAKRGDHTDSLASADLRLAAGFRF